MDASYSTNWFDIKFSVKNKKVTEPIAYEDVFCKEFDKAGHQSIY